MNIIHIGDDLNMGIRRKVKKSEFADELLINKREIEINVRKSLETLDKNNKNDTIDKASK